MVGANFRVLNIDGEEIVSQILPIPEDTLSIPGRESIASHILYFTSDHIPPLGSKIYQIEKVPTQDPAMKEARKKLHVDFSSATNELFISNEKEKLSVGLELLYYEGHGGLNDKPENRPSGAYNFR